MEYDMMRHLLFLYTLQTDDEKRRKYCSCLNGKGFNKIDAKILTSIAEHYIRKGAISQKQYEVVQKRIHKYHSQWPPGDFTIESLMPRTTYAFVD